MKNHRLSPRLIERTTLAGILVVFSSQALAQTPVQPTVRRGMVSGAAVGISLQAGSTSGSDVIRVSPPLNQSAPPSPFDPQSFPGAPDYSLSVMFPGHPTIEVDALSTGNDFIGWMRGDGQADLWNPFRRWQGVTVSVTDTALGNSPQSLLQQKPLSLIGPEASLITHYLKSSAAGPGALPYSLVGKTVLEQDKTDLGFAAQSSPVIDGLDWALGIRAWAAGNPGTAWPPGIIFNHGLDELYFSVSGAWATANPTGFVLDQPGGVGVQTRGGDVYLIIWDGISSTWSTPVLFLPLEKLGLDPEEDVDALAYDAWCDTALYSTTLGTRSQILAYQSKQAGRPGVAALPYKDTTGNGNLTESIGLRDVSDDVSAICVIDPEPGVADPYIGILMRSLGLFPEDLGLCVERSIDGNDLATLHLQSTGTGGIPQTEDLIVEFIIYHPSSGAAFTSMALPGPFGVAELKLPIGSYSGLGALDFCAGLWRYGDDGTRTLVGFSWVTTLSF